MRVLVTNTALLNTGDAAIMLGTQAILRRATDVPLEISVRDQQPEIAARFYREFDAGPLLFDRVRAWRGAERTRSGIALLLAVALLWRTPVRARALRLLPPDLQRDVSAMAGAGLIVSAGGTYLVPHYRLPPKLLDLLVARCLGRPYVLFTQSLGPFPAGRQRRLLRFVLAGARLILVRDARSRDHLTALGIAPARVVECADAAFALQAPPPRTGRRARPHRVAVSVRDWPHFPADREAGMERYLDAVAAAVDHLVTHHGVEVTFLSTCQGVPDYWTDDARIADTVVARLSEAVRARVRVNRDFHRPEELLALLSDFDGVVATRMHVAILALAAGVPVVPIAYEFKTKELFAHLGLDGIVADIETITAEGLRRRVDDILVGNRDLVETLAERTAGLRESAFAVAAPLGRILEAAR